jgi:hypothetical protein
VHPELENLPREIAPEVQAKLAGRAPHMVGAAVPTPTPTPAPVGPSPQTEAFERAIRGLLDVAAMVVGGQAVAYATAHKDAIRKVVGEAFLEAVEKAVHALKDAQPQAGA